MRPVLFVWRGIAVRSYPVLIYAALLVAVVLAAYFAQAGGLDPDSTALAVLLLYVPAFIGARLLYVARNWSEFRNDRTRIVRRSDGGMSYYGGLLGLLGGSIPITWAFGLPLASFLDVFFLSVTAGLAVAKLGCLLNGCCYGRATDHWCGVRLPDDRGRRQRRFPAQLVEMIWALLVLAILLAARRAAPPPGLLACAALALQSAGRLFLQQLRDEGPRENAAVRKTCLAFIAAALAAWLAIGL